MQKLIKDREIIDNTWQTISGESGTEDAIEIPESGDLLIPLALWQKHRDMLLKHKGGLGLLLEGSDEPDSIVADLPHFSLVTIHFPAFTDGRGYSLAYLLRSRYGYKGELRAVGEVLHDQLFNLHRCGFNAFAMPENKSLEDALQAYDTFSIKYQASADGTRPIFRQRA